MEATGLLTHPTHKKNSQCGVALFETLIAVALLGIVAVTIEIGLGTVFKTGAVEKIQTVAMSLAQSQLEYVNSQAYDSTSLDKPVYQIISKPDGYDILLDAVRLDPDNNYSVTSVDYGIQQITVTITHNNSAVITVSTYKVGEK